MGERGPAPKRDAERRRRNAREVETQKVDIGELIKLPVDIPTVPEEWHPTARFLFESFSKSGQAMFYEPTDWATIYVVCEQIHHNLSEKEVLLGLDGNGEPITTRMVVPMPGAVLNAVLKSMSMLLATEADRRRLSLELERNKPEATVEGVTNISSKRRAHLA